MSCCRSCEICTFFSDSKLQIRFWQCKVLKLVNILRSQGVQKIVPFLDHLVEFESLPAQLLVTKSQCVNFLIMQIQVYESSHYYYYSLCKGSNTNTSTSTKRNKALTCAHRSELEICCSRTCASRHMLQPSPSNAMLLISTNVLPLKRKRRTDGDENAFENLCRWWSRILQSCRQNWTLQKETTTT